MLGMPENSERGVTLIELMVTVVVAAILASIALPAIGSWIRNKQIRTAAEAVQNGLQLAKMEAVRRNARTRFVLGSGSSWTVSTDDGTAIQTRPSGEGSSIVTVATTPAAATTATFNSYGRLTANADGSGTITQVDFSTSASDSHPYRIILGSGGRIKLCDPAVSSTSDPSYCS